MKRVVLNPALLRWARERAGLSLEDLAGKFRKLGEWEAGKAQPPLKQVEGFTRAVHVPIGYRFLSTPPEESIPIPGFRTTTRRTLTKPSPDLLNIEILGVYVRLSRPLYDQVVARMKEAATLATLSDTLLPKIMSGEIRSADA